MGRKGSNKKPISRFQKPITLREESIGKMQTNVKAKSMLKLQHIKNLALWASGKSLIPSLGAFFGRRYADTTEALGATPDPSLFPCERCETILLPGDNCTVRIMKNTRKARRKAKKSFVPMQNKVVYECHFCSHRNLKRGTQRGYVKDLCRQSSKPLKPELVESVAKKPVVIGSSSGAQASRMVGVVSPDSFKDDAARSLPSPSTPMQRGTTLLESGKRKRNRSRAKEAIESGSATTPELGKIIGASNKQKRNSWLSLKKIAESNRKEIHHDLSTVSVPFNS